MVTVRPLIPNDLPSLKSVIDRVGLFPSDLLGGMVEGCLSGATPEEIWLTAETDGPVGLAYCAPERMTSGTWNVLLIAVDPDAQRRGVGKALMAHVEARLSAEGHRVLLVETSGLPAFEGARRFYGDRMGFDEEARIREFYDRGEDKVIFRKALSRA